MAMSRCASEQGQRMLLSVVAGRCSLRPTGEPQSEQATTRVRGHGVSALEGRRGRFDRAGAVQRLGAAVMCSCRNGAVSYLLSSLPCPEEDAASANRLAALGVCPGGRSTGDWERCDQLGKEDLNPRRGRPGPGWRGTDIGGDRSGNRRDGWKQVGRGRNGRTGWRGGRSWRRGRAGIDADQALDLRWRPGALLGPRAALELPPDRHPVGGQAVRADCARRWDGCRGHIERRPRWGGARSWPFRRGEACVMARSAVINRGGSGSSLRLSDSKLMVTMSKVLAGSR